MKRKRRPPGPSLAVVLAVMRRNVWLSAASVAELAGCSIAVARDRLNAALREKKVERQQRAVAGAGKARDHWTLA